MTPQRVADAARISPYPFVVHQVPSSPPENGDRSRPAKGKKKPKPRTERPNQQEEESRFNIGPVRPGTYGIRRNPRQPGRSHVDDRNGIPDYPPPSFQEAINASGLSPSPSTNSLAPVTIVAATVSIPDRPPEQPLREPTTTSGRKEIDPDSDNASDPDDSGIVIINKNEIPVSSTDWPAAKRDEGVKKDLFKKRRPELPGVSTSNLIKSDEPSRGRRPALRINPEFDPTSPTASEMPLTSPKRRFLSLSPIRTIFPLKTTGQQDRFASSTSSPVSPKSPLNLSRNFLRSTTSLVKLPGSSPPTTEKKQSLSRRLFSHKGKERAKDPVVPENLEDNWEVVESSDEAEQHPQSLMSAVESLSLNGSTTTLLLTKTSPSTTKPVQRNSSESPQAVDNKPIASFVKDTMAALSPVEDEARPDTPIETTNLQNESPESPPTSPTLVPNTPTCSTPPIRSLALPLDSQVPTAPTAQPHVLASPMPIIAQPVVTSDRVEKDFFQLALDTPLPETPVYQTEQNNPPVTESRKEYLLPPLVPVAVWRSPGAARSTPDFLQERYRTPSPGPVSSCSCGGNPNVTTSFKYMPSPLVASAFPAYSTGPPTGPPGPTNLIISSKVPMEEPFMLAKHHYSGRPLPRLPPSCQFLRTNLDPMLRLKDGNVSSASLAGSQVGAHDGRNRVEDLLIDLEDTSLDSNNLSPTTTTTTSSDDSRYQSQIFLSPVSPTSSDFAHEPPAELMDLSFNSIQAASTPVSAGPTQTHSPLCPHHHHHHHQQQQQIPDHQRHHQTLPQGYLSGFLKSNHLDLPVRYCDGLHCELHSCHQHHHHDDASSDRQQCWLCQQPPAALWHTHPQTNPSPVLPLQHGIYHPQHYHQHIPPVDMTTQRQRHHVAHY